MHQDRGSFEVRTCGLVGVHAVEARSAHAFPRHTHDEYGLGLIVSGAQRSWSGRGRVEAGCGDMITCNPGEVHDGTPIGEHRVWKMLYVAPALVAELASDIRAGVGSTFEFELPVIARNAPVGLFVAAYRALTARHAQEPARERLILLLARILAPRTPRPAAPAALRDVKARLDDDPVSGATLEELARIAGLSRYQLLRSFARATGMTPHAYVVQRRLAIARKLIAARVSLADAASASGFADQSHFTRAFTRMYGVTPGQFAQALQLRSRPPP